MIRLREGIIKEIILTREGIQEALVEVEGSLDKAINYTYLTGPIASGDKVVLNTTAVHLNLGTGGAHFVIFNYSNDVVNPHEPGHIMKMRYSPFQVKCQLAEEMENPLAQAIKSLDSLEGMPVIACSLHSMIAPVIAGIKSILPQVKLAYIMTDGGALPLHLSKLVASLQEHRLIDVTITTGHAFGGDIEAANIYSGLLCAKASGAKAVLVAMGPGIVGTGTKFGHTGIEQGEIINAIGSLKGVPIIAPRISFSDRRERHYGISHHTITALTVVANYRVLMALADEMAVERKHLIQNRLMDLGIPLRHSVLYRPGRPGLDLLKGMGISVRTMGRGVDQDEDYFLSCSAVGNLLTDILLSSSADIIS